MGKKSRQTGDFFNKDVNIFWSLEEILSTQKKKASS
jgi:hypothetical protein